MFKKNAPTLTHNPAAGTPYAALFDVPEHLRELYPEVDGTHNPAYWEREAAAALIRVDHEIHAARIGEPAEMVTPMEIFERLQRSRELVQQLGIHMAKLTAAQGILRSRAAAAERERERLARAGHCDVCGDPVADTGARVQLRGIDGRRISRDGKNVMCCTACIALAPLIVAELSATERRSAALRAALTA